MLTGASVPSLNGIAPGDLVAFRYLAGWVQIPVQVDERAMQDFGTIYNQAPVGVSRLQYTDAGTFTGADPTPTIDADDEIVFMARDAGDVAPGAAPAGVVAGSGVRVTITDPLDPGATGHAYLFQRSGALDPGAGQTYVSYAFNLLSGAYLSTYQLADGPNPENSSITSAFYGHHFGDRWQNDALTITSGSATGVDILDRHKALFAPGNCVRSEDTFNDAEGAFVINKSGPVRAIRSYIGANSGPLTQREHVFYEQRHDIRTFLRVHPISGIMDFFDYSAAGSGLTYYNNLNMSGVPVDGTPETPAAGSLDWEMVAGPQGSLVIGERYNTDITLTPTSYYLDDNTLPLPATQCTGDAFAYGSSGPWINHGIPNTDPDMGAFNTLEAYRTLFYLPPGATTATAAQLDDESETPLAFSITPFIADTDSDGIADGADNCPTVANPSQADADADALGDACEAVPYGTNAADPDTDDDGCADGREVRLATFTPQQGGDRDPLSSWDFFDVPVPALTTSNPSGMRNEAVLLADALAIVFYAGTADNGGANINGVDYDTDLNGNSVDDGREYDRAPSSVPGKPWRSGAPNGAVTLSDALVAVNQVGHSCAGIP